MNKKDSLTKFPQSSNRNKTGVGNIILTLLTSGEKGENAVNIVEEGLPISLVLGDMTQISADAYIVPHFNGAASFGGVGGAIANGGAIKGMEEYEQMIEQEKKAKGGSIENFQEWSKATVTESGGGNSKFLIHVVSVGSGKENEFNIVSGSVCNALSEATKRGLRSVVIPLLGTGIIGDLTAKQAANAIMIGVMAFQKTRWENTDMQKLHDVTIVIYGDKGAFDDVADVLKNQSYKSASTEIGHREFDFNRRKNGMAKYGIHIVEGPKNINDN